MTEQHYRGMIAHDWMEKGAAALKAGERLLKENLLVGCVNRLYYAAFYAVSAVLASEGKTYGRHSAVRASVHRDYVKSGRIPPECGKTFDRLFDDRQQGDYTPKTSFTDEELQDLLVRTRAFIECFRSML